MTRIGANSHNWLGFQEIGFTCCASRLHGNEFGGSVLSLVRVFPDERTYRPKYKEIFGYSETAFEAHPVTFAFSLDPRLPYLLVNLRIALEWSRSRRMRFNCYVLHRSLP